MSSNVEEIQSALPAGPPTEAPATPPPSTPPAATPPAEPAKPESRRDIIAKAMNNRGAHAQLQPREQGRFAGPPQVPPPAASAPVTPQPPVASAPVRPEMPKSLKLDLKQHWEATHPDLAAAIHQRELDFEKGVLPLKEKARLADDLLAEFKPYEAMMRAENATPKQTVNELLRVAAIFRTGSPVQKAQTIAHFMRQFSISPQDLQQVLSGVAPPQPALDPQSVSQLVQQQVQQALTAQQQQQLDAQAQSLVSQFGSNAEHVHFAAVRSTMAVLLQDPAFLASTENLSDSDKLKAAYDSAVYANPTTRAQAIAAQQAKEAAERQSAAQQQVGRARQAAVQLNGAPPVSVAPQVDPKDRRALIASQLAKR